MPIVIRNADRVAAREAGIIRKGTIDVAVLPPVSVSDWTTEHLDERIGDVRKLFADALADWPGSGPGRGGSRRDDVVTAPDLAFSRNMEPFDYLMFRGEGNPHSRSPILAVSLLDTNPGIERLRAAFDRASRVVLRLRQRVVAPALPVTSAQWVVDPDFDLTYHVRRVRAPAPGRVRDVLDLATSMMAAPLDTARPLWEALLVEDVDDDGAQAALIMKVNHSLTDGVGAVELLLQLYDFERQADRGPMPPLPVPEDRSSTDLVTTALRHASVHAVPNAARRLGGLVGGVAGRRSPPRRDRRQRTTLRRIGAKHGVRRRRPPRCCAGVGSGAVSKCSTSRSTSSAPPPAPPERSVNDAYIAALCGALRRYHEELGVPVTAIPLAIPINIRTDDDPAGGNHFGGARLVGPVGVVDPLERMRQIRDEHADGGRCAGHQRPRRGRARAEPHADPAARCARRRRPPAPTCTRAT